MNLTSILGFIALAGWLMVLAGVGIAISNAAQNRPARGAVGLAALGLAIGVLFGIASSGLLIVGPTEMAVVFQSVGGNPATNNLWSQPLGPGVHIIVPIINEPIIYSTETRTYTMSRTAGEGQVRGDDSVQARTRDGQQVDIDISVQYAIDTNLANTLHIRWQNRFENDFVRPTVRSEVRQVIASYSVNDLYGGTGTQPTGTDAGNASKLDEVQSILFERLSAQFKENGLVLRAFLLRDTTFSEEFIRAVEAKQVAEQQAEQAKQEAARRRTIAQGEADAAETAARGEANANIERARGEASAITTRAEAEAKALDLINQQISKNPQLIYWRYIERLADNISMVLLPSNSPFLFDMQTLTNGLTPKTNATPETGTNP